LERRSITTVRRRKSATPPFDKERIRVRVRVKVPLLESHKRAVGAGIDENAGGTKGAVRERE